MILANNYIFMCLFLIVIMLIIPLIIFYDHLFKEKIKSRPKDFYSIDWLAIFAITLSIILVTIGVASFWF